MFPFHCLEVSQVAATLEVAATWFYLSEILFSAATAVAGFLFIAAHHSQNGASGNL